MLIFMASGLLACSCLLVAGLIWKAEAVASCGIVGAMGLILPVTHVGVIAPRPVSTAERALQAEVRRQHYELLKAHNILSGGYMDDGQRIQALLKAEEAGRRAYQELSARFYQEAWLAAEAGDRPATIEALEEAKKRLTASVTSDMDTDPAVFCFTIRQHIELKLRRHERRKL